MLLTHAALDPGQLDALRRGELTALESLFRANFAALLKSAVEEPGDAALAPQVIERAFVRLWAERATIDTPEALDAFLGNAVHTALVRERSRRAAIHRLEENVHARVVPGAAPPSVDEAWARVASGVEQQTRAPRLSSAERAAHSRHAAAEHVASFTPTRTMFDWRKLAGSIVLIAALVAGLSWLARGAADDIVDEAIASPESRQIATRAAERASVPLRDGSVAALGADSRLRLPVGFGRELRALGLEGTARFTVAPDQREPLDVRVRNISITSPAGVFAVRAYASDSVVSVVAREGEVTLRIARESQPLAPGAAVTITRDGVVNPLTAPALDEALGWADGRLVLAERPLREVLPEFRRWYLLDLYVQDTALGARPVSMSADLESSRQALAALERAAEVRLGWEGKTMVLRDVRPAGARRR